MEIKQWCSIKKANVSRFFLLFLALGLTCVLFLEARKSALRFLDFISPTVAQTLITCVKDSCLPKDMPIVKTYTDIILWLNLKDPQALTFKGYALAVLNQDAKAQQVFDQCLRISPSVIVYYNEGILALRRQDTVQALDYFQKAVAIPPQGMLSDVLRSKTYQDILHDSSISDHLKERIEAIYQRLAVLIALLSQHQTPPVGELIIL